MGNARRSARPQPTAGRTAVGTGGTVGVSRAGVCIVRVETQGPSALLITVTRYPDVAGGSARGTTHRTVEVEEAVAEVRRFLSEFGRGG